MEAMQGIKKVGRPRLPDAMTGAQRQAARRQAARDRGIVSVTIEISQDLFDALDKFMQFKDITKGQVIEAALRDRFMRKR